MSLAIGFVNLPNLEASSPNDPPLIQVRYDRFVLQLFKLDTFAQMMNHAALGVCGEAGELADAIKKHIHYGKPLDHENVIEELGDLRFYMQAIQNMLGITEQELLQHNANKLAARYGSLTYSDKDAVERKDKISKSGEANG
jgi:NTP pyrophosphatase (non-canonical NTP hydrolase)